MALEQVNAFYDTLMSDRAIYEQYYRQCCVRGLFGIWDWDKTKIVNFATTLGYSFTESELDAVLFGSEPIVLQDSINLSEYKQYVFQ
ncbi:MULTISPECIES: Nif11-like leader peptide family natural product precursor [Nostocales]|uniref:Uncharacterized protein n=3 Tax=Nostocales TaxID=1161 RepID=A0A0C1QSZ7_9CYAN|nr:Nif11-like leader peptide family natural product precursor [Tolypothrix bouteillei]KAF3889634.1 hypothetical protein DA73_0400032300 [Tolypothrix bouteillei VB521301]